METKFDAARRALVDAAAAWEANPTRATDPRRLAVSAACNAVAARKGAFARLSDAERKIILDYAPWLAASSWKGRSTL